MAIRTITSNFSYLSSSAIRGLNGLLVAADVPGEKVGKRFSTFWHSSCIPFSVVRVQSLRRTSSTLYPASKTRLKLFILREWRRVLPECDGFARQRFIWCVNSARRRPRLPPQDHSARPCRH
ncbi:hypothetical protein MAPG_10780 [Magnaporthiopsis poae ATCC 64411]|uniref:Uncharacterized protein n=1 Tax=Magnaporthiopsis poae (strain ATCC 64411 / 73-15) TaxID=644358 RepID=A0A0C4EDI0_MAGP6|nr:hypothetical protein MAPG_10780 [Magnaporthiopsis poae ATCC 64411]